MRVRDAPAVLGKALRYQSGRGCPKDPSGRIARAYYVERLRGVARDHGGKLLSLVYVNDSTKLRFRCSQGHEFLAAPTHVNQGKWCPSCGFARAGERRRATASARLREIVRERRGVLLTPTYVNSVTKLRFQCARGHQWEAVPASILQGTWCGCCSLRDPKRHESVRSGVAHRLQRILEGHGGTLLSEFLGLSVPIRVSCSRGHSWETTVAKLDGGAWCQACKEEDLMEEIRRIAGRWGGECLFQTIRGGRAPLRMICARGHRWISSVQTIKAGHWCPRCRCAPRGDIEQARRSAHERGGECLSRTYVDESTPLRWRCREGHVWDARPGSVIRGSWCRVCSRGWGRSRARLSIEIMREMAAERGGECLSKSYGGIYDRLKWRCARGHTWTTPANNVRRGGWCPTCSHVGLGTLEAMRALALQRGGRCVTTTWNDRSQPLRFECGRGHRFSQYSNVVRSGVWCPDCGEVVLPRGGERQESPFERKPPRTS